MGHLNRSLPEPGVVRGGEQIAQLGDYVDNENGGWSRHLHLQALRELPSDGQTPIGYATAEGLPDALSRFPDPLDFFPDLLVDELPRRG